jgi:hypothetical protein
MTKSQKFVELLFNYEKIDFSYVDQVQLGKKRIVKF